MVRDTTSQEVLRLVTEGFGVREIARRLKISEDEVRSALRRALSELKHQNGK